MNAHPLVGTRVPKDVLVDVDRLRREYHSREPDFGVSSQRVRFGISGHRGSSLRDAFKEAHIVVDPLGGASVGFRAPITALYRIDIHVVNDTVDQ
jgi:phosphoglucomutase